METNYTDIFVCICPVADASCPYFDRDTCRCRIDGNPYYECDDYAFYNPEEED